MIELLYEENAVQQSVRCVHHETRDTSIPKSGAIRTGLREGCEDNPFRFALTLGLSSISAKPLCILWLVMDCNPHPLIHMVKYKSQ